MSPFVLDTDTLTLLEEGHPVFCSKVNACPAGDLAVTVVMVEEKLTGWYTLIRRAKKREQFIHAYHRLAGAVELLRPLRVLEVSNAAFDRYQDLKTHKLGVKKMDLLIAAIVLDVKATLVTRNRYDFEKVPGLVWADWSIA